MTTDELKGKLLAIGMTQDAVGQLEPAELEFVRKSLPDTISDSDLSGLLTDDDVQEALDSGDEAQAREAVSGFLKSAKAPEDDDEDDKGLDAKIKSAAKDLFGDDEDEGDDDDEDPDDEEGDDPDDEDEDDMEKSLAAWDDDEYLDLDDGDDYVDLSVDDIHKSITSAVQREQANLEGRMSKRFERLEKGIAKLLTRVEEMGVRPSGRAVSPYSVPDGPLDGGGSGEGSTAGLRALQKSILKAQQEDVIDGDQALRLMNAAKQGPEAVQQLTMAWGVELPGE
jgi:hypothetical protein